MGAEWLQDRRRLVRNNKVPAHVPGAQLSQRVRQRRDAEFCMMSNDHSIRFKTSDSRKNSKPGGVTGSDDARGSGCAWTGGE
jgi:hypothetical protein